MNQNVGEYSIHGAYGLEHHPISTGEQKSPKRRVLSHSQGLCAQPHLLTSYKWSFKEDKEVGKCIYPGMYDKNLHRPFRNDWMLASLLSCAYLATCGLEPTFFFGAREVQNLAATANLTLDRIHIIVWHILSNATILSCSKINSCRQLSHKKKSPCQLPFILG